MDLSIIIPVSNDARLNNCLESIVENTEVVVVLNQPSKEIQFLLNKWQNKKKPFTLKVCEIDEKNLAKARNEGVRQSKYDSLLFIDSDCTFDRKLLHLMYKELKGFDLVKGKLCFQSNGLWSNITKKRWDSFYNNFQNRTYFFTPNLAIKKSIFEKLGMFDESFIYSEDFEFNYRTNDKSLRTKYEPNAVVYHPPIDFITDNRSHFRYGMGFYLLDKKYETHHGLKQVYSRFSLTRLVRKKDLGITTRSMVVGTSMLAGYVYATLKGI